MKLTREEIKSKLDYLENISGLTDLDEELATEDLKRDISEDLIAMYCGKSVSASRKKLCSSALRRGGDEKVLAKILKKEYKDEKMQSAYALVEKGVDIQYVIEHLDDSDDKFGRLYEYWLENSKFNKKASQEKTSEEQAPRIFSDKADKAEEEKNSKEELDLDFQKKTANPDSAANRDNEGFDNRTNGTSDEKIKCMIDGLSESMERLEKILTRVVAENAKTESDDKTKAMEEAIVKRTEDLKKRIEEREAEFERRLSEREERLAKLLEEKESEIEKKLDEQSTKVDEKKKSDEITNDTLSDRVDNLEVFADATNHRMESYMKQISSYIEAQESKAKKDTRYDTDETLEDAQVDTDKSNSSNDYMVVTNDRRGNIVSAVPIEIERRKSSGIGGLIGMLGFKKRSQRSLVRMAISGELDKNQLKHIATAIKSGLRESQLCDLIENRVSAERMPELIEIAMLENRMSYAN